MMEFSSSVSEFNNIKERMNLSEYILEHGNQKDDHFSGAMYNLHFTTIEIFANPNVVVLNNKHARVVVNHVRTIEILDENSILGVVLSIRYSDNGTDKSLILIAR